MNEAIDFSTLNWVKNELDVTLKEARQALEAYVENPEDEAQAGFLAAHLHQVYGTLQMVELYGASLLAEEMEHTAVALQKHEISQWQEACEVLMRAILQLPDYLDRLIAGHRDIPLVLLPLLNDLRAVRGQNLLSESSMFSPDLDVPLPESLRERSVEDDIQQRAREIRHRFQLGLLGWFRERNTEESLAALSATLETLISLSRQDASARLWWIAAGVTDALRSGALTGSVSVKRLLGQVDRCIKRVIDGGEDALASTQCEELTKNLLFYIGEAKGGGGRVSEICATYRVHDLLPGEGELAAARESLSGQNADLFRTVAVAVKEELGRLKDSLDIILRSGRSDAEEMQSMAASLRALSDTLGMLGLGAPRQSVLDKANELQICIDQGQVPAETVLMDVASTLLFVESAMDRLGQGHGHTGDTEQSADQQLAASEFDQVKQVVLNEAISDLARAKEAIVGFVENMDFDALGEVPQLMAQVKGGLLLLGESRAASLIDAAARYISHHLIDERREPPQQELDSLADAICGIEYFLEGRREHRMYGNAAMNIAEQRVESLGYPAQDLENAGEEGTSASSEGGASDVGPEPETMETGEGAVEEADLADLDTLLSDQEESGQHAADGQAVEQPVAEEAREPAPDDTGAGTVEVAESEVDVPVEAEAAAESDEDLVPAAAAPAQCEDDVFAELAILGEDTDEEILEIFIEEAEEEIASIQEQLPRWTANQEDSEALSTMRRSYHTLKGSGRLIGAMRIGEFAWAFENMLNRVIDGTVAPQPVMFEILQEAVEALPELVAQIQQGTPVSRPAGWLMQCADALSKGETPPARAPVPDSDESGQNISVEPVLELDEPPLHADEAEPSVGAEPEAETADMSAVSLGDGLMDQELYEIFYSETQAHLAAIQQFLDSDEALASEELVRALHTLHGSAHMAEADAVARLAGELEKYVKAALASEQAISADGRSVLADGAGIIAEMLKRLPEQAGEPEGFDPLLERIANLQETAAVEALQQVPVLDGEDAPEEPVMEAQSAPEPEAVAESDQDPYAHCDPELLEIFLEEGVEILERSDAAVHAWRETPDDQDILAELQRELHTLKGGARMADITGIGDLAHAVESLIIAIVERGAHGLAGEALEGVQEAQDQLVTMLEQVRAHEPLAPAAALIEKLNALREQTSAAAGIEDQPVEEEAAPAEQGADVPDVELSYLHADPELLEVFLEEAHDILEHSENTLQNWKHAPDDQSLMAELQRELHTLKGGARMADITEIGDLAHAIESLMVAAADGLVQPTESMFSVLEQAHDRLVVLVGQVGERQPLTADSNLLTKLEALREGRAVVEERQAPAAGREEVEIAVEQADSTEESPKLERRAAPRAPKELVRVRADVLDNLVNFAGEVSIYRSRLEQQVGAYRFNLVEMEQTVARLREQLRKLEIETEAQILFRYEKEIEEAGDDFDPLEMDRYSNLQQLSRSLMESVGDLDSIQNLLENITRESETLLLQQSRVNTELQEGLMRTRMVPFLGLAPRMRRIVRQTCQQLGKKAELELSGAEGEMDRTVIDRIIAPIEHMLRNAISHGIETPGQRIAAGKPESGTIRVSLARESSDVVLRIEDDGAGMNLEAIRRKAIERGLLAEDAHVSDNEVLQYVLETGFSTAEKVTQIAGRGVGMDVVNSEVKQLGGSLHIDSVEGKGTTFTIRLPFTLAVNQALLVEVGEDPYAIPLSSIQGIVRMRREDLQAYYDDPAARFEYGGFEYEVSHLGTLLGTNKPNLDAMPRRIPVLLVRTGDQAVALQVENLMGSREIVVKSVGPQISTVRGVSGATILGDGSVVMILDVSALLRGGTASMMSQVEDMLQQPAQSEGVTVMVVDDSITVRKVTTRLLERNEMNVVAAKDGVDAVSKLQDHLPDVMLLDIEMPRMDGFELATHVRNEPRLKHIPIIMITSRTGDKHRQRAMEIGVNRYLGKPFQEAELLATIEELLEATRTDA